MCIWFSRTCSRSLHPSDPTPPLEPLFPFFPPTPLFSLFFPGVWQEEARINQGVTWRVSASPHFSRRKTNTEKRERGGEKRGKRSPRRICSWQLFQQPILIGCNLVPQLLCFVFDKSFPIFIPNVRSNCCFNKKGKKKKNVASESFTFHRWFRDLFSFLFFYKFNNIFPHTFPVAVSSRSFPFSVSSARFGPDNTVILKHLKLAAIHFSSVCLGISATTA